MFDDNKCHDIALEVAKIQIMLNEVEYTDDDIKARGMFNLTNDFITIYYETFKQVKDELNNK